MSELYEKSLLKLELDKVLEQLAECGFENFHWEIRKAPRNIDVKYLTFAVRGGILVSIGTGRYALWQITDLPKIFYIEG